MDIEKINVCHDLGITYHEDLGLIDGYYCELVKVGPIERIFKLERSLVDYPCENPGDKRLEFLEKKVAELHEEIKSAMDLSWSKDIVIDDEGGAITICGIRYSRLLFEGLGFKAREDEYFQVVNRDDGLLTIHVTRMPPFDGQASDDVSGD